MTPEVLSLSNNVPLFLAAMLVKILAVFVVVILIVAYATWVERKVIGHMQTRLGPMRTGWHGLLQPIADGLKLFFKEDIIPAESSKLAFILAPMMILVPAFITIAVVPFGPDLEIAGYTVSQQITDLNIGILYVLAMAGLGVYGIVLAGWASNNKYSLLGGVRSAAQMVSYELAAGLSIIAVFMLSETLSLRGIVEAQQGPLWGSIALLPNWYVFTQPLAFGLFVICGLAEINRTPFDLPEAETELVSGFCTEYSSMKYALFFMAEYANMVVIAALIATLFLGGWSGPFPGAINLLLKIFTFMFFFIWLRATFPRVRYDQLMFMGWKVFLPLSLANIVVTGLVVVLLQQ
ncbi:MAG: NADH-quinone oxidoreductase subunit NuoH [Desulfuromonas sp.]|uniref:NADH-quinone oxidoreductase subunit NuoH n=1 Tax=Desulfuromonas sp. TaxID=892 RepID=UPI000CAAD7B8|nr:NADH-quinone oxidoreductase subunit NuoH [Desulfuromonas sp.]PLX84306.1 MAG: NADH-quinone oxidoreductase subunit NuoH [Desulfuromonas sp.]